MARHKYTPAQIDWLRRNVADLTFVALTQQFNATFDLQMKKQAITSYCHRKGFVSDRPEKFRRKGLSAWNKGIKGLHHSPTTEFKPGQRPHNWQPVGYERVGNYGLIEVKMHDGNQPGRKWKSKASIIFEKNFGKPPEGYLITVADGNPSNLDPSNLIAVSKSEMILMNKAGYRKQPPEIKPALLTLIKLENKIRQIDGANPST